jgi:predicted metal-dependent enzyme (double-stranded beta helix superfamily)
MSFTLKYLYDEICNRLIKDNKLCSVRDILEKYNSLDWKEYVKINNDTYNKHLVYHTDLFDIFIITWKAGQRSKIHDHPNHGCLMKILDGHLSENLYNIDKSKTKDKELEYLSSIDLRTNAIGYKEGCCIVHDISALVDSVSIHIYSPGCYKATCYN